MRSSIASLLASLALLGVSGCVFYADDDDECLYGGSGAEATGDGAADPFQVGQRNPESGECEYFGGGGGDGGGDGGCDPRCGECPPLADRAPEPAQPSWGFCESECTGLDEAGCLAENGCRAIYIERCIGPDDSDCASDHFFAECWSTDMTGPIQGGGCAELDAFTCSQHDDCIAVHTMGGCDDGSESGCTPPASTPGPFFWCDDEPTEEPGPGTCDGQVTCERLPPECPANTLPGIANGCYTDYCIPVRDCDNEPDPGVCYAAVTCDAAAPACPGGTTAGIENGCYTGYCIPLDECEEQASCSDITVEATCIDRADCVPFYEGVDCDCTGDTCDCADWVFQTCN